MTFSVAGGFALRGERNLTSLVATELEVGWQMYVLQPVSSRIS